MSPRRALAWALALSLSVYLVPLVGPHAVWFLGEALAQSWSRADKSLAWRLIEWAVALGFQTVAAVTWYWILRRPRSPRPLTLLLAVPAVVAANVLYLVALPARFLIGPETAREEQSWPVLCSVPDVSLVTVAGKAAVVRPAGEALMAQDTAGRLARLVIRAAPDDRALCEVAPLAPDLASVRLTPVWIGEDGRALLRRSGGGRESWEWIDGHGGAPATLDEPPGRRASDSAPVVSRAGDAIAWVVPVPDSGQPPALSVVVRAPVAPSTPRGDGVGSPRPVDVVVPLDRIERGGVVVLDVDRAARELLLAVGERRFVAVGLDGAPRWGPVTPDGVEALSMTFRRVGEGWVAWDGYRDRGGYGVAWALADGRGLHRVPEGRGITDVAVHSRGRFIAISVTTSLSIGSVADSVYVLRAADGAQVFRRFLPRYTRSTVAFPRDDLFAYTEWDGAHARIVVLRLPP